MNEVWFMVWIACVTSLVVLLASVVLLILDYRRFRMIERLDRSRQALMDMEPITVRIGTPEPITVRIGTPLYDWEQEDTA